MLDAGLRVRLIVAAVPAPPVQAPPGKPPFHLSSYSSSFRRSCSSWWFSNGDAHRRDTTTATTSSRATRRRWWSDPDGSQEDYGTSSLEQGDYEDEAAFSGFGLAGELLFDESWFSKVFKTYGVLLPVMLTSMFAATGLKAFLMAMAIPLSQSAISSFLLGRRKGNRDDRWWRQFFSLKQRRRPFQEEDNPEDATDFATGGRGNGYSSSSSNYYQGRRRRHNYQSWVSKDFTFADAASTAVGADDNTKSSSCGDGGGGNKSSCGYGGWDELLDSNIGLLLPPRRRRGAAAHSQLATLITARNRGLQRLWRKMRMIPPLQGVGAPPERMRMRRRRRRMPRTMGLGRTRYKQAPFLMRFLVAVFPFLRSWFRLLYGGSFMNSEKNYIKVSSGSKDIEQNREDHFRLSL